MQISPGLSPGSWPFEKVTRKSLTFWYSPSNGMDITRKKTQPSVCNFPHALFWFLLALIRAPLPTQISRTLGTLPCSYTCCAFHSWGSKSSFVCGSWLGFALWSCAQFHIINRLFALPFWRGSGWTSTRGRRSICWCGTTRQPLL